MTGKSELRMVTQQWLGHRAHRAVWKTKQLRKVAENLPKAAKGIELKEVKGGRRGATAFALSRE